MPRVENCGTNVDAWHAGAGGNGSSTYDVCRKCVVDLRSDPNAHNDKLKPYNDDPQGVDGWRPGVDHPDYTLDDYSCAVCGCKLNEHDD